MVTAVRAWQDGRGDLHATHLLAAYSDAAFALRKIDGLNEGNRNAVLEAASEIVAVLTPLVEAQEAAQRGFVAASTNGAID